MGLSLLLKAVVIFFGKKGRDNYLPLASSVLKELGIILDLTWLVYDFNFYLVGGENP